MPRLMKYYRLNITPDNALSTFDEIMTLQRQFNQIEIEIAEESYENSLKILFYHGSKVVKLVLSSTDRYEGVNFTDIVTNMHRLEELLIREVDLVSCRSITLPHLKKMVNSDTTHLFLKHLVAPNLESLELSSTDVEHREHLSHFLKFCPKLKTLVFKNEVNHLPELAKENLPFNLQTLKILDNQKGDMESLESILSKFSDLQVLIISTKMTGNVMFPEPENTPFSLTRLEFDLWSPSVGTIINDNYTAFLRTQSNSLKELKSVSIFPNTVELDSEYLTLFTQMKVLEKITFDRKNPFPKEQDFYDRIEPITNVKELHFVNFNKLEIKFRSNQETFLRGILPKLPDLEVFEASDQVENFPDLIRFLSVHNPKLKLLSLWTLENYEPTIRFQNLENLNLKFIGQVETLEEFKRNHPKVKECQIDFVNFDIKNCIEGRTDCTSVVHL